jgi:hypothetical protein
LSVPSHIARLIRERHPQLAGHTNLASAPEATFLAGILAAVRDLPDGIVPAELQTRFTAAIGSLNAAVESCFPDSRRGHLTGQMLLDLLALLAACPDEPFRPDDASLDFIDDPELRRTLSVDLAAAHRALAHGEWKAATVLAGSVLEALCVWIIRRNSNEARNASVERLLREGVLRRPPAADVLSWQAAELIEVAFAQGAMGGDTVQAARQTKDYRNLIHPGRELRTGQQCTEGTAHIAIGAMQRVVEDLKRQFTTAGPG